MKVRFCDTLEGIIWHTLSGGRGLKRALTFFIIGGISVPALRIGSEMLFF